MSQTDKSTDSATVIVRDSGFGPEDLTLSPVPLDEAQPGAAAIDVPSSAQPEDLAPFLAQARLIRIDFPSFADGRGFTLARLLRLAGYAGRLRAHGHVIADQYTMARRSGFDEVEIPAALALRQPEEQWIFRADWDRHDYRARLRAG